MKISCDCGKFTGELNGLPKHTPGRLVCYCKDCQDFANKIGRSDVLDEYGGTQVVPVYPKELKILTGSEYLKCNMLKPGGLTRFSVTCCNSPIGNTKAGFPWLGVFHTVLIAAGKESLNQLGPVKARIYGKSATSPPPFAVSDGMKLSDFLLITPFLLKGVVTRKAKNSPFFEQDGKTPICETNLL